MKRIFRYLAVAAIVALFFVSCSSEKEFNREFLVGRWECTNYPVDGQYHKFNDVYYNDGTGYSWDMDPRADITEDEAKVEQAFRWTLSGENLKREERTAAGSYYPFNYTVSELTETKFVISDTSGRTFTWTKVN